MSKSRNPIISDHIKKEDNAESHFQKNKGLDYESVQVEGIIVWNWTRETIPSDIYFLPAKLPCHTFFNDFVHDKLSDENNLWYEVIFAPMRHTVPNLERKMNSLTFVPATLDKFNKSIKISYGRITYELIPMASDFPPSLQIFDVSVTFEDTSYCIHVKQEPDEHGFPMFFEKLDFKIKKQ